ncbi:phage integrase N-terminal SAM-like domain-containing protein [Ideonella sp.]|uniref:phage integrase N-terminal SAM-like domain-containing protein n=1 Tax=Ideonella sp. TaxID=1929293 RepID=UPI003BB7EAC7
MLPTTKVQSVSRLSLRPAECNQALPPLRSVRLLDLLRERLRYQHCSLSTEKVYVHWCRDFIRYHGLRHPC